MVLTVFVVGTIGYIAVGLSPLDAVYMTVITITTVGYREVVGDDPTSTERLFTIVIIVTGVSTVLYSFTLGVQVVVEGQLQAFVGRRRMDKRIANMHDHVIVCGWGRVGKTVASDLTRDGKQVVILDRDAERIDGIAVASIVGDATVDSTLLTAGIERASALVAAVDSDAENLFVTLSSRSIRDDLFIVARARQQESIPKLQRAGADRVVNPQGLGAARMASFIARPNVAEFVDVIMHERSLEFRMQEFTVTADSPLAGLSLADAHLGERSGVLVLAVRDTDGTFASNPAPDTALTVGRVIIAVGTDADLARLDEVTR